MKRLFPIVIAVAALSVPASNFGSQAAAPVAANFSSPLLAASVNGELKFTATPAPQRPEFLNNNEIYEIREAQDVGDRLKLYVNFAKVRIDTIAKLAQSKETDRGEQIHDALYEYDRILDAIDKNVDEAVKRRDIFKKGLQYALDQVPNFLKQLEALRAANAEDLEQYKFILDQAIGNTRDDADSLAAVLKKQPTNRKEEKDAKAAAEKAEKDRERQAAREKSGAAEPKGSTGSADPSSRPGWNPNTGPPTRKKPPDPQDQQKQQPTPPAQKPPQKDPPGF